MINYKDEIKLELISDRTCNIAIPQEKQIIQNKIALFTTLNGAILLLLSKYRSVLDYASCSFTLILHFL